MWLGLSSNASPRMSRWALIFELLTLACIVTAAAMAAWVWRVRSAYDHFRSAIQFLDPAVPIREWSSTSLQPELREVYYLFCFPCFFLPVFFLTFRCCVPLVGKLAEKYSVKKRLLMPFVSFFVFITGYAIAVSPLGDTRAFHIASSNLQLLMLGWVTPCLCSVLFWMAGVGLFKSITGR